MVRQLFFSVLVFSQPRIDDDASDYQEDGVIVAEGEVYEYEGEFYDDLATEEGSLEGELIFMK